MAKPANDIITGLDIGSTAVRGPSAMVNLVGSVPQSEAVLEVPGAHLHLYGKSARPGRKLGHVTICTAEWSELNPRLLQLAAAMGVPLPTLPG